MCHLDGARFLTHTVSELRQAALLTSTPPPATSASSPAVIEVPYTAPDQVAPGDPVDSGSGARISEAAAAPPTGTAIPLQAIALPQITKPFVDASAEEQAHFLTVVAPHLDQYLSLITIS